MVARSIARWNGFSWEALGSGLWADNAGGANVTGIAAVGDDVFVGGILLAAGVSPAGYFCRWNDQLDFTPPSTMWLSNPESLAGGAFKFRVTATEQAAYVIEATSDYSTWLSLHTNSAPQLDYTDSTAAGEDVRAYRTRQIP